MNSVLRNLAVWFVLGSLLIYVFNNIENSGVREQISYSQFKEEVLSDRVAKVVYKGDQMTITGERLDGSKFETTHPIFKKDEAVDNAIQDNGIIAVYEKIEQPSILSQLLVGAFPPTIFQPNFGVGLHLKSITIDYALTDIGDQSAALYSNIFSIKLDLNKSEK